MPTKTSPTRAIERNIRFNKALETFKYFASKWNNQAREVLVMQIEKGLKEAQIGSKKVASEFLMNALYERFHNDRDNQFYWGNKGQQYLGEAIHDFVPVAILCYPKHLKQIRQFCLKICPKNPTLFPTLATELKAFNKKYIGK